MARSFTPAGIAKHFAELAVAAGPKELLGNELMAEVGYRKIRAVFGDSTKLADLMPSTQEEREFLGYTPNDPLKRSGELMESVKLEHLGPAIVVGTEDEKMEWLEYGFINARTGRAVVPRPAFRIGTLEGEPEYLEIARAVRIAVAIGDDRELSAIEARVKMG